MSQTVQKIHRYTKPYSKMPGYQEVSPPIWYDPHNKIFALGEFSEIEPDWSNWYWNIGEQARVQKAIKSAGIQDTDPIGTQLAGVNPQYYSKAQEFLDIVSDAKRSGIQNLNNAVKSAAILKREDFTAFKTILPQTKIIAAHPRRHILLDMLTVDNSPDFLTKIYTFDGPYDVVQENLTELNVPDITGFPGFTPQLIPMERYGIHYAFSEEFIAEQFDFNIKDFVLNNIAGQMDIVFNKKVADLLNNTSTFTAYGDWTAKTGNVSTRDPAQDINSEAEKIFQTERNEGTVIASNRHTFNAYISSTWNSGFGTPSYKTYDYTLGNVIATSVARFPAMNWGIDSFIATGKFCAFDPAAIYAARMPQRIVDYKAQYQTHIGTIIRQNFIVKPLDSIRILGGSGVST